LPCNLDIIDTAGQDDFLSIRESYYREGEGFLCVYDVTSRSSFHEARWCLEDIKRVKGGEHVPFFLAGNKCDVHTAREVTILEGANLAKTFKCKFLETSAKNRTNVDEAFLTLAKDVICWKMFKDSRPLPIPRKKKLALTPRCVLF
jgi:GTPase KRas protein